MTVVLRATGDRDRPATARAAAGDRRAGDPRLAAGPLLGQGRCGRRHPHRDRPRGRRGAVHPRPRLGLGPGGRRGARARRGGHLRRRVAVADPRRPPRAHARWGESVSAYYRSQFLNSVLPGGVVGDVHRAVAHGREREHGPQASRAVVAERIGGTGGAARPRGGGAGVDRDVGLRSRCGHRAPRGRRRLRRTGRRGGCQRARPRRDPPRAGRAAARVRHARHRGQGVRRFARGDRRPRRDVHRRLPRRRRRRLARAARRRRAHRRARRLDPAQHRRMGPARGRGGVGVRGRRPRCGGRHRGLDGLRRSGADRGRPGAAVVAASALRRRRLAPAAEERPRDPARMSPSAARCRSTATSTARPRASSRCRTPPTSIGWTSCAPRATRSWSAPRRFGATIRDCWSAATSGD